MEFKEFFFEKLDSTQEFVKRNINILPPYSLVEALKQTQGKTRKKDKIWYSKEGEGLYITFVLPKPKVYPLSLFSLIFSLNLVDYINNYFYIPLKIKWPNDIYLNQKKLAGILLEYYKGKILLGMGINLYQKNFPPEIKDKATSFLKEGYKLDKEEIKEILKFLVLRSLKEENFDKEIYEKYLLLKGKFVKVKTLDKTFSGIVLGVSNQGELILKTDQELIKILEGEVIFWEK
ncbi:MAG TPA: biotin--[acetyl-CoA-carboxylase] ligase [Desulfurobacteriaceae bacterium]|nr:biotin--[acetyl-CoA-carboxylase] ligase [Desulfurobacteriaceae bacterium]